MRRFFISFTVPIMLYVADLFLVPRAMLGKGSRGFISRLAKIQRQVALHITGALRSAPTDAIDAGADILPFQLLVKKLIYWAASRLATLPQSHLLEKHVNCASSRYIKSHRALVHEIMHAFNIHPAEFKTISTCNQGLKLKSLLITCIPASKEAAVSAVSMVQTEVFVF